MRRILCIALAGMGMFALADEREALTRYQSVLRGMSADERMLVVRIIEASLMVARDEVARDIRHNANAEASWWKIVDLIHKTESKDPIVFTRDLTEGLNSNAPDAFRDIDILQSAIFFSLQGDSVKNPEKTSP